MGTAPSITLSPQSLNINMKLFSLALSAVLASCALAQRISIGSPADMATVAAGSELVVEVDSKVCHLSTNLRITQRSHCIDRILCRL